MIITSEWLIRQLVKKITFLPKACNGPQVLCKIFYETGIKYRINVSHWKIYTVCMCKCMDYPNHWKQIAQLQLTCSKRANSATHLCGWWCLLSALKSIFVALWAHAIIHRVAIETTAHTTEAWWREVLVASLLGHSPSVVVCNLFRISSCGQKIKPEEKSNFYHLYSEHQSNHFNKGATEFLMCKDCTEPKLNYCKLLVKLDLLYGPYLFK